MYTRSRRTYCNNFHKKTHPLRERKRSRRGCVLYSAENISASAAIKARSVEAGTHTAGCAAGVGYA